MFLRYGERKTADQPIIAAQKKNEKILFFIILCSLTIEAFSQTPIVVADMSFKSSGSEPKELYYSFAEGDIIVVDFEVVKGKNIKSFEVIELPSSMSFLPSSHLPSAKKRSMSTKKVFTCFALMLELEERFAI